MHSEPWGVILAGGQGKRLKSVSRLISGDDRPKQFCEVLGRRSLLAQTRARVALSISPFRTLFAVLREHETYFRAELKDIDESRLVIQPADRGTTAAIVYCSLRIVHLDADATVAFFPADHFFARAERFREALDAVLNAVEADPGRLFLLGAEADGVRPGYGWIEPGSPPVGDRSNPALPVVRFREKPDNAEAEELLRRGCLWNTFVIAGRARAFLDLVDTATPGILPALRGLAEAQLRPDEAESAFRLYQSLPARDFSHEVLSAHPDRLGVVRMAGAGWTDLGTPEGVLEAAQRISDPASSAAFTGWLLRYTAHLDQLRRTATAGK